MLFSPWSVAIINRHHHMIPTKESNQGITAPYVRVSTAEVIGHEGTDSTVGLCCCACICMMYTIEPWRACSMQARGHVTKKIFLSFYPSYTIVHP